MIGNEKSQGGHIALDAKNCQFCPEPIFNNPLRCTLFITVLQELYATTAAGQSTEVNLESLKWATLTQPSALTSSTPSLDWKALEKFLFWTPGTMLVTPHTMVSIRPIYDQEKQILTTVFSSFLLEASQPLKNLARQFFFTFRLCQALDFPNRVQLG